MKQRSFLQTIGMAIPSILGIGFTKPITAPPTPPGYAYLFDTAGRGVAKLAMLDGDPMLDPYYTGKQDYTFTFEWLHPSDWLHIADFELWRNDPPMRLCMGKKRLGAASFCVTAGDTLVVTYERTVT
jgi:hypothetical protein